MDDLIERLHGPHEWGYRDPVEGGFVADDAPYQSADRITTLEAENARLREGLEWSSRIATATLKNKDTT